MVDDWSWDWTKYAGLFVIAHRYYLGDNFYISSSVYHQMKYISFKLVD